jgi:hypothetical protein
VKGQLSMRASEKNAILYSIQDSRTLGNGAGTKSVIILYRGAKELEGPVSLRSSRSTDVSTFLQ